MNFDRNRTNGRTEVEETAAISLDAKPVGQVSRVCDGRRQSDDSQLVVGVRRDEVGSGDDNFEDWTAVLAEKVDLVDHDQPDGLTKIRRELI